MLQEELYCGRRFDVTRVREPSESVTTIVKSPADGILAEKARQELENESHILQRLTNVEGVVQLLRYDPERPQLVLYDRKGAALQTYPASYFATLKRFFSVSIALTQVIGKIHERGITHCDINPSNIIYCESGSPCIELIDFGLAVSYRQANEGFIPLNSIIGTLSYMSPEQTGRTNRPIDYRTDFYSLGATLYELLTGRPPSTASDPIELVHAHLARVPDPPHVLNSDTPKSVSDIVVKLLAKNAEERYQSAHGLEHDLRHCYEQWLEHGRIEPFELGRADHPIVFTPPTRLYGREQEQKTLLATFRQATAGPSRSLMVAGDSGVGKSALVSELYRPITESRGMFVQGKFEQHKHHLPYHAISQALGQIVDLWLSESAESLAKRRAKLPEIVEENAALLVELVPKLAQILGPVTPSGDVVPNEIQTKLQYTLLSFVSFACSTDQPLVFFVDDLQWADPASLSLIGSLLTDTSIHGLLLIGAYRNNEVDAAHPLVRMLNRAQAQSDRIETITLHNLSLDSVRDLLGDMYRNDPEATAALAKTIYSKTQGNIFYVLEFLRLIQRKMLLRFSAEEHRWVWEQNKIDELSNSENVINFLIDELLLLPQETQHSAAVAACLGNTMAISSLCQTLDLSIETLRGVLLPLIEREVLLPTTRDSSSLFSGDTRLRFCHDRMQQAAYALLSDSEKTAIHYRIAKSIDVRGQTPPAGADQPLTADEIYYNAVEHYERALPLIAARDERIRVAELAAEAGRRARRTAAFNIALRCLNFARELLPADAWNEHPALTFSIEVERHAALFILSHYDECDQLFVQLTANAPTPIALTDSIGIQSISLSNRGQYEAAVRLGLQQLHTLGFKFPDESEWDQALGEELGRLYEVIGREGVDRLATLDRCHDQLVIACFDIINRIIPASFFWDARRSLWMILRGARMCYEHGYTEGSGYVLVCLMLPLAAMKNDFETAHQIAERAMELVDRHQSSNDKARSLHVYGLFQCHWFQPLEEGLRCGREAHERNVRIGDMELACFAYFTSLAARLDLSRTLGEVEEEVAAAMGFAVKTDNAHASASYLIFERLVATLRDQTSPPGSFDGDQFSEATHEQSIAGNAMAQCYFLVYRALSACIFGDFERALALCEQAAPLTAGILGFYPFGLHRVLHSLALCQTLPTCTDTEVRAARLQQIDANQAWLAPRAAACPQNFAHLYKLIDAERSLATGDFTGATATYEQAAQESRQHRRWYHYALVCELAGRAYLSRGLRRPAQGYLQAAYGAYKQWGAAGKIAQLDTQHDWLSLTHSAQAAGLRESSNASVDSSTTFINLDSTAIIRAFRALSSERTLERLLVVMQDLIMRHSGADRGLLFIQREGRWQLAVSADTNTDETELHLDDEDVDFSGRFSARIFHYCTNSLKPLVIADVRADASYRSDEYFTRSGVQAVAGLPIVSAGRLEAVLLLENRVTTGAFTVDKISIVELIGGQFAIALQNALIYRQLEDKVAARTAELEELNQTLERRVATRTEELKASERYNRMLFEESPVGLVLCDRDGRVVDANSAYADLVGQDLAGIKQMSLGEILAESHRGAQERNWQLLQETGRYGPIEQSYLHRNGDTIPVQVNSVRVQKNRVTMQWLAVADISLRKQAEQQHIEARRAAERANRAKSRFLANMSHELRTPLNAIIGFNDLLTQDAEAEGRDDMLSDLRYVRTAADHLLALITDILDLSKIESGSQVPNAQRVELRDLIDEIVSTIKLRMENNQNHLTVDCDPAIGSAIIDPLRTRQILLNLLDNASKFTKQGQIFLSVHKRSGSSPTHDAIEFRVRDTGDGIDPSDHERIFHAFEQVDSSSTREHDGSGLGLALCRKLCHLMLGSIRVESELGHGATFIVELPTERVLSGPDEKRLEPSLSPSAEQNLTQPGSLRAQQLILLIDPSAELRSANRRLLEGDGYEVLEASSALEGLRLARSSSPDAIVLDMYLPDLSGWALLTELRVGQPPVQSKVIPITTLDDVPRCVALDAGDYLVKPLRPQQLLETLAEHLHPPT